MSDLAPLTESLRAAQELTAAEVESAAAALASAEVDAQSKSNFLVALADKGETAAEIAAFARSFRTRAIDPGVEAHAADAIDIVGTGGDHSGGFNISSMVVLVLASAGVKVMKHGNRGITSACGSADLLAGLGVKTDAPVEQLRGALDELGFCFFFAPAFHPAFKHIVPVRKALAAQGRRTVFNILGPTINPGRPAHVLLGVFAESWVERMAAVLSLLDTKAGLVAHGVIGEGQGIDEVTTATENRVRGVGRLGHIDTRWTAAEFGLPVGSFEDLKGGDVAHNLAIVDAVLAGKGPPGLVDTIVLNAALGLWATGKVDSVRDGLAPARESLLGGAVQAKIAATREFYGA
ncbi:anthranilate phosphoribosyltransferase [Synoicihabitans lomoniglobus]|uniref:Anthranilate phosphoribosyltransferase n=1 Tax=Synoicihabitans lomoniglobus TaxID=2909285 RepID=A0AAF0CSA1_9BACT|nr:anthranilate phosphoribosyltransferase [Opitutaceae bacterium LMO-M01]WED67172.1 anthranilate phosphoribosyltransferase [Opitutaceae bacterium LMO-M01]